MSWIAFTPIPLLHLTLDISQSTLKMYWHIGNLHGGSTIMTLRSSTKIVLMRHGQLGSLIGTAKKVGRSREKCKRNVLWECNHQDPVAAVPVSPPKHLPETPTLSSPTPQAKRYGILNTSLCSNYLLPFCTIHVMIIPLNLLRCSTLTLSLNLNLAGVSRLLSCHSRHRSKL